MTSIPSTMFDFASFYDQMAQQLPRSICRIAEVGVADGASALYLASKLWREKVFHLRMIDSLAYGGVEQLTTLIKNVRDSGMSEAIEILPMDSLNASLKFPDGYFHMVFLDSGHTYELTKAEIRLWQHKIMDGWFLCGHDYYSAENPGVRQAVDELIPQENLSIAETEKGYGVWILKKDLPIKQLP